MGLKQFTFIGLYSPICTYVQQTFRSVHQTIISDTEILNIVVISISQVSQIRLYMSNRDYGIKTVYIHRTITLNILRLRI